MEGIAGIIYPDVFQVEQLILPMLDTLRHRGTPVNDIFTFKNIQIGMCGGKLFVNEKKTVIIAFDGALYEKEELYHLLVQNGYPSEKGNSTSQLLIHAYETWGSGCFSYLKGDFAIAILDTQKEKVILARDRIGRKPLYWYNDNNFFIFASELKALLSTGSVPQTPSQDALASYLYFGYIPQDMTPIKDVNKLLPGHYLQFSRNRSITIQSYWSYSSYFEKTNTMPKNRIVRHLDELLQKSVKERIPSGLPVGCFLSGGLGSSSIAYYLKKLCNQDCVQAFSVGYQGQTESDMKAAGEVAKTLDIEHNLEFITSHNFLDDLVTISWYLDEPNADPFVIANWRLAKMASNKVKTVFSGMGSDEILAGHSRYSTAESGIAPLRRMKQELIASFRWILIPIFNYIYPKEAYELLKQSRTNPWQFDYLRKNALFDESNLSMVSPRLSGLFDPEVFLHKFHNLDRIKSNVASFLYFDVKTRLADSFLLQVERMTAAHGLNWETPFLDRHIVEFLAGLPEPEQLSESETASFLRTLLQDVFSTEIVARTKRTRREFLKSWSNTPELSIAFKLLSKGTLVETGLISPSWLNYQLESPKRKEESFRMLWGILMMEIWFRLYINRPIQVQPPSISLRELLSEL